MLVVDTKVIAYLYLDPAYLSELQRLLQFDSHWIAPSLWRSELRSMLIQYLRKELLEMDQAVEVMVAAETLLGDKEFQAASVHILALALASGCSTDDCEFVALAREFGTVLITYDQKLLVAFPSVAYAPRAFLALSG